MEGEAAKPCLHDSLDEVLGGWKSFWQQPGVATEGAACIGRILRCSCCFLLAELIDPFGGPSADDVAAGQADRVVWALRAPRPIGDWAADVLGHSATNGALSATYSCVCRLSMVPSRGLRLQSLLLP
jgi:hypothetical protein